MSAPTSTSWSRPEMVAGFAQSPPNATLIGFAATERCGGGVRALDIGCGAARNAVPLAALGWTVIGLDRSEPMLAAAAGRARAEGVADRVILAVAGMDALPVPDASVDLVVAHGIWNLARSGAEFRRAVGEAARVARRGAALFVFTFSRRTLPAAAAPLPGESFVFTQFSGEPQVFLTEPQLLDELEGAGFVPHPAVPLTELNAPRGGTLMAGRVPVIYQASFRRR